MPTIYLPIPKSSPAKPIWFFNKFTYYDIITLAKQSFYPDLTDPTIWEDTRFIYSVDKEKECVTVEYVVSDTYDEETGKWENESSVTVFYFNTELRNLLWKEYDKSKLFIDKKIDQFPDKYKARDFVEKLISLLTTRIQEIENLSCFSAYKDDCQRPFKALIRSLYSDHKRFTPRRDPFVVAILDEREITKSIHEPQSIKISICKGLMELRSRDTDSFFLFYDPEESTEPPADTENKLKSFITGNFNEIKDPICFFNNITEAYYFIRQIANISGFRGVDIEAANIFMMKKNKFSCGSYDTAINRIGNKRNDGKNLIDQLISENII